MFNSSYKIATVFGIPIKVHISVIILLLMYVNRFSFPFNIFIAVGILVSIALHELGHSLVAIAKNCGVKEITLWFMGGVAQMEKIPKKPLDEFLMAIAGPAVSLGLGLSLVGLGMYAPLPKMPGFDGNYLEFMGFANIFLTIFNMIPAFPMDGGRVLRAGLTPWLGRLKATRIAANIGKLAALGFIILAFKLPAYELIILAVFLYWIAGREYRYVLIQERGSRFGFWDWINAASGRPKQSKANDDDEDQVLISPPPYERGPSSRSRLTEDYQDPINPFGKV